ncbi:MAG: HAD-IA family hydrolase [Patescibacteria group bacterium]|nr:HAD-IA family hydrolase [Patescibacteria group bacterium]
MKKYIVFDFDGTIADTYQDVLNIVDNFKKNEYKKIDFRDVKNYGMRYLIKKAEIPFWEIPKFVYKITSELKNKTNIRLFPEILDVFKKLSANYKLGILSSNSEKNIRIVLKKYKIENLFEFIYTENSIFGKHSVLKGICKKYGINHNNMTYVGDEDRDIIAAKKAKIKIIAVTWGFNAEKLLKKEKPDYLVHTPKEILEKIL